MWADIFSFGREDIGKELTNVKAELTTVKTQNTEILRIVRIIMGDVKIQQESLDGAADVLLGLVATINELDLTPLPDADQSRLVNAVISITDAVNGLTGPTTPNVPAPNPEPEPTPAPEPEAPAEPAPDAPA